MRISEIFDFFRRETVEVGVVEKDLWFDRDPGLFPSAIREAIAASKEEIVALVEAEKDYQERLQHLTPKGLEVADASWAQQRIWFLSQLAPESPVYNICMAYRASGVLDVVALEKAIDRLVERHSILRSVYEIRDNELVQVIRPHTPFRLTLDLTAQLQNPVAESILVSTLNKYAEQPFDLKRDIMLRCVVIRLSEFEHVIAFCTHHIAFDGWSASIFFDELKQCYGAFKKSDNFNFEDVAFQYADFSEWQTHDYGGIRAHEELAYWEKQLSGLPALHSLPLNYPRPLAQTFRGANVRRVLKPSIVNALRRMTQQQQCTLFTLLKSVLALLVHRLSGQKEVCIGVPVANRLHKQIEATIGCFVNTVAIRSDFHGEQSFERFLELSQRVINDAFANQEVPFELVVGAINPERTTAHSPLFQVMFDLQIQGNSLALDDLQIEPEPLGIVVSKFDLCLCAVDKGEIIELLWDYSTDLFKSERVEMICDCYELLLQGILKDSGLKAAQFPLIGEKDLEIVLRERNKTYLPMPEDALVSLRFERQVETHPDGIALSSQERSYTYAQLNEAANQLAHHLRQLGVGCDDMVGLCMARSAQWSISVLAIIKAGGAYLPLDPDLPASRLKFMLGDAKPKVVISLKGHAQLLGEDVQEIIWLDEQADAIAACPSTNPECLVSRNNLAYVIYTSGSTGEPKGVLIEHGSWINFIDWIQAKIALTTEDCLLVKAAIGFDVSVMEVMWPLLYGARAHIAPENAHRSPDQLLGLLVSERVSVMQMTPSLLAVIIANKSWKDVKTLRNIVCGGEILSASLAAAFHACSFGCRLINFYGPTEATIGVSCWPCEAGYEGSLIPIGGPMQNTQFYVLNEACVPQPDGVIGELYIGGSGVARGYLNRPELTRRAFIKNPFSEDDGLLYKTGDLVRWNAEGTLDFIGRQDQQVKIRGFRIELGEIERAVLRDSRIKEAVVIAHPDESGDESQLVGYFATRDQESVDIDSLRTELLKFLPDYMVPTGWVMLEKLPLNFNGKVDYKQLPAPTLKKRVGSDYVAPRTATEELLASVWSEVLKVDQVGVHDNFFTLGGHSLKAALVSSKIKSCLQKEVLLKVLFEKTTVEALAEYLDDLPTAKTIAMIPRRAKAALPDTAGQL